jgi:hypothetical protein
MLGGGGGANSPGAGFDYAPSLLGGDAQPDLGSGVPEPPRISAHGSRIAITSDRGCTVYYTADGKDPSPASAEFPPSGSVDLGIGEVLVKAIAVRHGAASGTTSYQYRYSPKAIAVVPESGEFEGKVSFSVTAEHSVVRYSTDGFVPTASSPLYEGAVVLTAPGQHIVTAAMFDGHRLIGDPVRRTYTVLRSRIAAPTAEPTSGSFECPMRITLSSPMGDVFYTLDGTDPTSDSTLYTGPILVNVPGDVEVRAVACDHATTSDAIRERYNVRPRIAKEGQLPERETAALPTTNVEFSNLSEMTARAKAEEVMAWVLAAAEVKERRLAEATKLERELFDDRDEYRRIMSQLDATRKELALANTHRRQLEQQTQAHRCDVGEDVERQIAELEAEARSSALEERGLDAQLQEAIALHGQAVAEKTQLQQAARDQRAALEATFLSQRRELVSFGGDILVEVQDLEMVVAEQRHEIELLENTYAALQRRCEPASPEGPFLPSKRMVELPSVETLIPIPTGCLRKVTTVQGTGLQELRAKHFVDACVVSVGSRLGIRVVGHSAGVHGFVEDIDAILNHDG